MKRSQNFRKIFHKFFNHNFTVCLSMSQETKVENLEIRMDDALTRLLNRMDKLEKQHNATSSLLRHVWELSNRQQELLQRQGSMISGLLKKLNK